MRKLINLHLPNRYSTCHILLLVAVVLVIAGILTYRFYQNSIQKKGTSQIQSNNPSDSGILYPSQLFDKTAPSPKQSPASNQKLTAPKTPSKNPTLTDTTPDISQNKILENTKIGYRLSYPADWAVKGAVVASEFQARADECQSVEFVDNGIYGTGHAGDGTVVYDHSGVQVCAKSFNNGLTLDQFMQNTYRENLASWFTKTTLNGIPVYQSSVTSGKTIFLQTEGYRMQIYSFVATNPNKQTERTAQIEKVLQSFSLL